LGDFPDHRTGRIAVGKSAIVLVIDRLGAAFLGPYGNTWLDTPQFNRLASRSLLSEFVLADAPDVGAAYRAWWTGRHALVPASSMPALPEMAREAGLSTRLVTDEPAVADLAGAAAFDERIFVPQEQARSAAEFEETAICRLMLAAVEQAQTQREPALTWIHSRGMAGPWDAPPPLRRQFADEDDPEPPAFVEPPERLLPAGFDPDEQLGIVQAYAGQVALVDLCLGLLLDAIDASPHAHETLVAFTSPRGYPLGEHRRIGGADLYGELLHVPQLVRYPASRGPERSQAVTQPGDLAPTLASWLELPGTGAATRAIPLSLAKSSDQRAVRTPAWFLRESREDDQPRRELFAKPDDRWEMNEVASRCGDIADQLAAAADAFEQAAASNALAELPPLAEILTDPRR
jgi:arylsulfatase A-like enzyme